MMPAPAPRVSRESSRNRVRDQPDFPPMPGSASGISLLMEWQQKADRRFAAGIGTLPLDWPEFNRKAKEYFRRRVNERREWRVVAQRLVDVIREGCE